MTNDLHAKYQKYKFYLKTQKSLLILQICCVILDELKTTCCDSCHDKMKRDFIKATAWSCSAFIRQSLGSGRRAVPKCHKKSDAKKDQIVCLHFICISCMLSIKCSYKQIKVQMLCVQPLCFGAQSIKHANVLSEKNHFSALGGPKVAMFGGDDLGPLHFDVSNFSVTPDPP